MNFELLHEIESVHLFAKERRTYAALRSVLMSLGFSSHDDIFSLDRKDRVPPWQHGSIAEVHVFREDAEVYDEGDWSHLVFDYLFASLPEACVQIFLDAVFQVAERLRLQPSVGGVLVDRAWLERRFAACSRDLMTEYAEVAGSEELAILIADTYPRKH